MVTVFGEVIELLEHEAFITGDFQFAVSSIHAVEDIPL